MKQASIQPLNQIYYQLSQLLTETLLSMYAINTEKDKEQTWQKAEMVLSLYEHHIAKEEALLSGFLHEYEPCVNTLLLSDYKIITKQIHCLRKMRAEEPKPENKQIDNGLLYGFNQFLNTCFLQMKEHQDIVNPVLWWYYSDTELKQMEATFAISRAIFTYPKEAVV